MDSKMDFRSCLDILSLIKTYIHLRINFRDFDSNFNDLFVNFKDHFSDYFILVKDSWIFEKAQIIINYLKVCYPIDFKLHFITWITKIVFITLNIINWVILIHYLVCYHLVILLFPMFP